MPIGAASGRHPSPRKRCRTGSPNPPCPAEPCKYTVSRLPVQACPPSVPQDSRIPRRAPGLPRSSPASGSGGMLTWPERPRDTRYRLVTVSCDSWCSAGADAGRARLRRGCCRHLGSGRRRPRIGEQAKRLSRLSGPCGRGAALPGAGRHRWHGRDRRRPRDGRRESGARGRPGTDRGSGPRATRSIAGRAWQPASSQPRQRSASLIRNTEESSAGTSDRSASTTIRSA